MPNFIERLFGNEFSRKVRSIKNEQDLVRLFEQHLLLNQTTKDEVVGFLNSNHLSFVVLRADTRLSSLGELNFDKAFDNISVFLVGPSVWVNLLPYGSQWQVRFYFTGSILSTIKAFHIVHHF